MGADRSTNWRRRFLACVRGSVHQPRLRGAERCGCKDLEEEHAQAKVSCTATMMHTHVENHKAKSTLIYFRQEPHIIMSTFLDVRRGHILQYAVYYTTYVPCDSHNLHLVMHSTLHFLSDVIWHQACTQEESMAAHLCVLLP